MLTRLPLRVKLIAVILVLLSIALTLIGIGSVSIMRGYLVDRVDTQIDITTGNLLRRLSRPVPFDTAVKTLPPDMRAELRGPHGRMITLLNGTDVEGRPGPAVPPGVGPEPYHNGEWRVRVTPLDTGEASSWPSTWPRSGRSSGSSRWWRSSAAAG
nr:hypothetical protein GCM10020093_066030 [Planobispora longispora]